MKGNRPLSLIGYGSLVILLGLELVLRYDTWVRQIALAITNISTLIALLILSRYLHNRSATLPWAVIWFSALGVWFDGMGNFVQYYATISWWDKLAHAVGSGALAAGIFVLVELFQSRGVILLGKKLRAVFIVSVTTTLSALYEISEYIGDSVYPTNRVTSLFDTADDLLWDFLAAVIAVLCAQRILRKKRTDDTSVSRPETAPGA